MFEKFSVIDLIKTRSASVCTFAGNIVKFNVQTAQELHFPEYIQFLIEPKSKQFAMGDLASKVTAALGSEVKPIEPTQPTGTIKAGDLVTITGSTYYGGKSIPGWVKKLRWYVVEVSGDRAVINKDESGRYAIMSPVKTSALAVAGTKPAEDYRIHTVVHGDTLWAIAKKYLGNGSRYKEIVSLNGLKSNVIYSGMKLKIPNK